LGRVYQNFRHMNHLNYHHLYYYKVIASEGSISKAAKKLRLGQPTLSMQLKQFEENIGHPLFDRKNRSLQLTEMGRLVLGYANEIFRLGSEMVDSIHDRPISKKLRLQIGALDSIPKFLIRALMCEAYDIQNCMISVMEGEGINLVENLLNHRLDLVISNVPAPTLSTERLYSRSLAKMPLVVVGTEKYRDCIADFPRSLNGKPFILPTSHSHVRGEIEQWFEKQNVAPNVIAETQDTSLMNSLAIEGHGMIALAEPSLKMAMSDHRVIKIGELSGFYEELWLISAQRKLQNPIAERLMKEFDPLRATAKSGGPSRASISV
jgi:LysR family transcriptional activator of nhaA